MHFNFIHVLNTVLSTDFFLLLRFTFNFIEVFNELYEFNFSFTGFLLHNFQVL